MARRTPRYTEKISSISPDYDRGLVLELLERQAQYISYAARTNTTLWQTAVIIDAIMRRTDDRQNQRNPGELMWRVPLIYSRNSNIGTFLANNFPKDHRIFNYVTVVGYAGSTEPR